MVVCLGSGVDGTGSNPVSPLFFSKKIRSSYFCSVGKGRPVAGSIATVRAKN